MFLLLFIWVNNYKFAFLFSKLSLRKLWLIARPLLLILYENALVSEKYLTQSLDSFLNAGARLQIALSEDKLVAELLVGTIGAIWRVDWEDRSLDFEHSVALLYEIIRWKIIVPDHEQDRVRVRRLCLNATRPHVHAGHLKLWAHIYYQNECFFLSKAWALLSFELIYSIELNFKGQRDIELTYYLACYGRPCHVMLDLDIVQIVLFVYLFILKSQ